MGYSVEGVVMEQRRRQHLREETADERLDRLIEMEKSAKEQQTQAPEVKRLTVTEGGAQAVGGRWTCGWCDAAARGSANA